MSRWTTLAAFAVGTTAITLTCLWPVPTHADGASPLVEYTVEGTKIDDVVARGVVRRSSQAKSGWVLDVTADNRAAHAESVPLETDLVRTVGSPRSRVMPRPETVWSTHEQVLVPAHGTVTRRYELPADLAAQLAQASGPRTPGSVVSFAVTFEQSIVTLPGGARGPVHPA